MKTQRIQLAWSRKSHPPTSAVGRNSRGRWSSWLAVSVLCGGLLGCGANKSATDTKTNWLSQCSEQADCGGELSCLCGICTVTCDQSSECTAFDEGSACYPTNGCGGAAAVCAASELDDDAGAEETDGTDGSSVAESDAGTTTDDFTETDSNGEEETDSDDAGTDDAQSTDEGTDPSTDEATDGATDAPTCERPIEEYDFLGDACDLVDFDCEDVFVDDCGCGCDDVSAQCRPEEEYVALGDTCQLIDFVCDAGTQHFFDDCGCGCEATTAGGECRPEEEYVALGDTCQLIDFVCDAGTQHFFDDCGCGCEPAADAQCEAEGMRYLFHDPAQCAAATFSCEDGETPFFDDCGCGCVLGAGAECLAPAGDDLTSEVLGTFQCTNFDAPTSQLVEDQDAYVALLTQCGAGPSSDPIDFTQGRVFAAFIPERPTVSYLYTVASDDGVHIGIEAPAYCGGAFPPTSMVIVQFDDDGSSDVLVDTCYTGECVGPLPP